MNATGCLNENTLAAFLHGGLSSAERAALEEHVDSCSRCEALLVEMAKPETVGALSPAYESSAVSTVPEADLKRGNLLGRYLIIDRIGEGAMGVIFAAYDPKLNRRVAIKVLRPEWVSLSVEIYSERLLREGQALARLSHPNVVAVHDVGTVGAQVFIAMEYVEGVTLRAWLMQETRPRREILQAFLKAGEGLAAAHSAGLVHRDFKPENVLVGTDGRVRVTDFGLARLTELELAKVKPPSSERPVLPWASSTQDPKYQTRSGALLGTPAYMAPEQFRGEEADARSDQYSFCVSLFEALYGRRPFEGDFLEPISERLSGGAPAHVRQALLRGLSSGREGRFPSMEALLKELSRRPALGWARALGAALVLGLLVFGAVAYRRMQKQLCPGVEREVAGIWNGARSASVKAAFAATGSPTLQGRFPKVAEAIGAYTNAWARARTEACEATRLPGQQSAETFFRRNSCLEQRLRELDVLVEQLQGGQRPIVARAIELVEGLTPPGACVDLQALRRTLPMPADPLLRSAVNEHRKKLAESGLLLELGQFKRALELAQAVSESPEAQGYPPLAAEASLFVGKAHMQLGQWPQAQRSLTDAVLSAEATGHEQMLSQAAIRLTRLLGVDLLKFDESEFWQRFARGAIERLPNRDQRMSQLLSVSATVLYKKGQYEQALELNREAMRLGEQLWGPEDARIAANWLERGNVFFAMGRLDEAENAFSRAYAIWEKRFGSENVNTATALMNLAGIFWEHRDLPKAIDALERALAIRQQALPPSHPSISMVLVNLSSVYGGAGDSGRALDYSARALELLNRSQAENRPRVFKALATHGSALADAGRFQEAKGEYEKALDIGTHLYGEDRSYLAGTWVGLGRVWLGLHQPQVAIPILERGVQLWEVKKDFVELAVARFYLAQALWDSKGDRARARQLAIAAGEGWAKIEKSPFRDKRIAAIEAWLVSHGGSPRLANAN